MSDPKHKRRKAPTHFTPERKTRLLKLLWHHGPLSRTELARALHIRQLSVNDFVGEMMDAGVLCVNGTGHLKRRGRRTHFIDVAPSYGCAVGVHVRDEWLDAIACDLKGNVLRSARFGAKAVTASDRLVEAIALVYEQMSGATPHGGRALGLGLAVPGSVDKERTTGLYYSHFPWWRNIPFRELLSTRLGAPVWMENDVRAEGLAEMWFGHGRGVSSFIYVDIGGGAAMTLLVDGSVYQGEGFASEWGHTTIDRNGPRCSCGNVGCLDELLSDRYLRQRLRDLCRRSDACPQEQIAAEPVEQLLSRPWERADEIRRGVLGEVIELIAIGVVNLVNTFNPSLIVLGGNLSELHKVGLLDGIWKMLRERAFGSFTSLLDVRITSQDERTLAARGAAGLVLEGLFRGAAGAISLSRR